MVLYVPAGATEEMGKHTHNPSSLVLSESLSDRLLVTGPTAVVPQSHYLVLLFNTLSSTFFVWILTDKILKIDRQTTASG